MYSNEPLTPSSDPLGASPEPLAPSTAHITFHYINGETESFSVYSPISSEATQQDVRQEMHRFLQENWWVIKTMDQTIFINAANVLKVEMEPPIQLLEGNGVFSDAERVTALHRYR